MNILFDLMWSFSETEKEYIYTSKSTSWIPLCVAGLLFISILALFGFDVEAVKPYEDGVPFFFIMIAFISVISHFKMILHFFLANIDERTITEKGKRYGFFSLGGKNPYTIVIEK